MWSDRHLRDHLDLSHRGGDQKIRGRGLTVPGALASLLDIPLVKISSDTLIDSQTKEAETRPGRAALGFRIARSCINWCQEHDIYVNLIDAKVHQAKRVRRAVPVLKPVKNSVQRNQLKDWFLAVNDIQNIMHKTFLQISILCGPRSESMRSLTYSHLDFKWKTISIWDKVEQENRTIPITPYVENYFDNSLSIQNLTSYFGVSNLNQDISPIFEIAITRHLKKKDCQNLLFMTCVDPLVI